MVIFHCYVSSPEGIQAICFPLAMFRSPEAKLSRAQVLLSEHLAERSKSREQAAQYLGFWCWVLNIVPTRLKSTREGCWGQLTTLGYLGMLRYVKVVCAALWDGERASGVLLIIYSNPMVPIFDREALVWEVLDFKKQAPAK